MKVWERIKTLWNRAEWTIQDAAYGRPGSDEQFHEWNDIDAILPPRPRSVVDKENGGFRYLCNECEEYVPEDQTNEIAALGGRHTVICDTCFKRLYE